jgi:hypothetical protein
MNEAPCSARGTERFGVCGSAQLNRRISIGVARSQILIEASWNKGEVVNGEFVVPGCHSPAMLDLVEEPLDQIASTIPDQNGSHGGWQLLIHA